MRRSVRPVAALRAASFLAAVPPLSGGPAGAVGKQCASSDAVHFSDLRGIYRLT